MSSLEAVLSRAHRLLDLVQTLRRRRAPVPGAELVAELGVSMRQLYRDIATLRADGALRPSWTLPPVMLTEVEALALGMAWVGRHGDPGIARAARAALEGRGHAAGAGDRDRIGGYPPLSPATVSQSLSATDTNRYQAAG